MKFLNTNGMAFVGPGSEWFWTAVSGLVLAGTFIAIYRQLRLQRRQIHENTKVLRSQAHYNALTLLQRPWELLIEDLRLSEIVDSGYNTLRGWIHTKPGLVRFWSESRTSFDEPFRSEVDREFARKPVAATAEGR